MLDVFESVRRWLLWNESKGKGAVGRREERGGEVGGEGKKRREAWGGSKEGRGEGKKRRRRGGWRGERGGGEMGGGRVGVKESLEARRICSSDSCYWPFFSPLPEMVELRPDRGDLNPFLSGRRLGPCGKYQNNLLLFLGGRTEGL